MLSILRTYWNICLLRLGPRDLPASAFLLYLALAAHATSVVLLSLAVHPPVTAVAVGVVDTLVLAGMTLGLLQFRQVTARFTQALSALAGTGALLGTLALVPTWWWFIVSNSEQDLHAPWMLLLALVIWSLAVMAHVLRHALDTNLFVGLLLSGGVYWVAVVVRESLFPVTP